MEDLKFKNVLYIILQYNFTQNLYDLIDNLYVLPPSFCSMSHRNIFKFFIQYKENYLLVFPNKTDEYNLILNLKYDEIKTIINKRIEDFFRNIDDLNLNLDLNFSITIQSSLNQIFKKILLENNRVNPNKVDKPTSILTNSLDKLTNNKSRILLVTDSLNENEILFNQKLLFLMKRQNIILDCVSIGNPGESLTKLQSAAFYTEGLYEHLLNVESVSQTLLQLFLPNPEDRRNTNSLFQFQNLEKSKFLECQECKIQQEICVLLSDAKEINCMKCFREKINKNK